MKLLNLITCVLLVHGSIYAADQEQQEQKLKMKCVAEAVGPDEAKRETRYLFYASQANPEAQALAQRLAMGQARLGFAVRLGDVDENEPAPVDTNVPGPVSDDIFWPTLCAIL